MTARRYPYHRAPASVKRCAGLRAPVVHFSPAPRPVVIKALELLDLRPGELLFDLGCGDGRILIEAARRYRVRAVGVEIRRWLASLARRNALKAGVGDLVQIIRGDFFRISLTRADAIVLYLSTKVNEALKPKLERELKPGARVVSIFFPIPGWSHEKEAVVRTPIREYRIRLYRAGALGLNISRGAERALKVKARRRRAGSGELGGRGAGIHPR